MSKPKIRKPNAQDQVEQPIEALDYSGFEAMYPNVYAMLFDEHYEDASRRQTSTILFFVERGVLKVCLNDRDNGRSAFISVGSIDRALEVLETALIEDTIVWRQKRSS